VPCKRPTRCLLVRTDVAGGVARVTPIVPSTSCSALHAVRSRLRLLRRAASSASPRTHPRLSLSVAPRCSPSDTRPPSLEEHEDLASRPRTPPRSRRQAHTTTTHRWPPAIRTNQGPIKPAEGRTLRNTDLALRPAQTDLQEPAREAPPAALQSLKVGAATERQSIRRRSANPASQDALHGPLCAASGGCVVPCGGGVAPGDTIACLITAGRRLS